MKRVVIVIALVLMVFPVLAEDLNIKVNLDIANLIGDLKESLESGKEIAPSIMKKAMLLYEARLKLQKNWASGLMVFGVLLSLACIVWAIMEDDIDCLFLLIVALIPVLIAIILFVTRTLIIQKMTLFPEAFLIQKIIELF